MVRKKIKKKSIKKKKTAQVTYTRKFWNKEYFKKIKDIERVLGHQVCGVPTKSGKPCRNAIFYGLETCYVHTPKKVYQKAKADALKPKIPIKIKPTLGERLHYYSKEFGKVFHKVTDDIVHKLDAIKFFLIKNRKKLIKIAVMPLFLMFFIHGIFLLYNMSQFLFERNIDVSKAIADKIEISIKNNKPRQVFHLDEKDFIDDLEHIPQIPVREKNNVINEVRGIQVFAPLRTSSLNKIIKKMHKKNINTLFYAMWDDRGVRFENSINIPVAEKNTQAIIDKCHENGIRIYAWMPTSKIPHLINRYPDCKVIRYDYEEKKYVKEEKGSIFHKEFRGSVVKLFEGIGKYNFDGVLFQDDLMLRVSEDYNPAALKEFQEDFGFVPEPNKLYKRTKGGRSFTTNVFWYWARWKTKELMKYAGELKSAARKNNSDLEFIYDAYYDFLENYDYGISWESNDIELALLSGFDRVAIMSYHRQIAEELSISNDAAIKRFHKYTKFLKEKFPEDYKSRIILKVQTRDFNTLDKIPNDEIGKLMRVLYENEMNNIVFFTDIPEDPIIVFKEDKSKVCDP